MEEEEKVNKIQFVALKCYGIKRIIERQRRLSEMFYGNTRKENDFTNR